ncbi:hypothetical protein CEXT_113741 [Caerostris extrusa]|uniref:Uncharacterized protein n=1 Tax=Caerostris extrusa TaxID=172846 RepID=A0AAV4QTE4_CAEEX|nr:hypothetical protein CEXT_113741 [Caerostris extrusa]
MKTDAIANESPAPGVDCRFWEWQDQHKLPRSFKKGRAKTKTVDDKGQPAAVERRVLCFQRISTSIGRF